MKTTVWRSCTYMLWTALAMQLAQPVLAAPKKPKPKDSPLLEGRRFYPQRGEKGMVVTSHYLATKEAQNVLKKGGNAVDAAVVAAFVLAVVQPRSGNIGGGGFMVLDHPKNGVMTLDFREKAPAAATKDMFLNDKGKVDKKRKRFSHLSAGVPGTVAGMLKALSTHGTYTRKQALAPAIRYAQKGFIITERFAEGLQSAQKRLKATEAGRKLFYKKDGGFYQVGERFVQPELARTLKAIQKQGRKGFYQGKIADYIVADMKANGGLITHEDLRGYKATWRKPIRGTYRGEYEVFSMPPPSSGGLHIVQLLNILENFDLKKSGHNSSDAIHVMAEAMKPAYADRSEYLGDPDFVKVPVAKLTSKAYAKTLAQNIKLNNATPSTEIKPGTYLAGESSETTHFSIVDDKGYAVSLTYTINFSYGSGIVVPGAGFILNNEMDDFTGKVGARNAYGLVGGEANAIAPHKRMLSSMSPTIVKKNGKLFMITGTPGGSRIITTTLQTILNVVDHGMNVQEAVNAPRIHHQWYPDYIRTESGISPDTVKVLEGKGHKVKQRKAMGAAQVIYYDANSKLYYGATDPRRRTGLALGF